MLSFVSNIFSRGSVSKDAPKEAPKATTQPQVVEQGPTKPSYAEILKKNATETPALPTLPFVPSQEVAEHKKKDRKVSEASTNNGEEEEDYCDMYKARQADSLKCERVAKQHTIQVLKDMGVEVEEGANIAHMSHSAKGRKESTGKWSVKGTVEDRGVNNKRSGKRGGEF